MPIPAALRRIPNLYHFTDRQNLDLIRHHGGLYPLAKLREMGVDVPAPGGNPLSLELDAMKRMDGYVHLCFTASHPMEFRARQDGRISDSIFLKIHPEVLALGGVMFTSDVANKSGVVPQTLDTAAEVIDFEVLYSRTEWTDSDVQQRLQQAEKYEILVPDVIPLDLIRNLPDG